MALVAPHHVGLNLQKHLIYRTLIAYLRGERFEPTDESAYVDAEWKEAFESASYTINSRCIQLICDYPIGFLSRCKDAWGISERSIIEKMVTPLPGEILNHLTSRVMFRRFDHKDLMSTGIFNDKCLMRFNKSNYRRGLLVPVIEDSRIINMRFYQHPFDRDNFCVE